MLKTLHFRFGRAPGEPNEALEIKPLTVFVGPNNSGKSLVLREIQNFISDGQIKANHKILHSIEFELVADELIDYEIATITLKPQYNETLVEGHIIVGSLGQRASIPLIDLKASLTDPVSRVNQFCQWYLKWKMLFLDGPSRILLVNTQKAGDLQAAPVTSFQALFQDDENRQRVRDILSDAFGEYFVIDPTQLGNLRIRMSSVIPERPEVERGISDEAVAFHGQATPIEEKSDGIKAFTGIIQEIIAGDPNVLLIDEPEAFLHPSLSFKLGKQISLATQGTKKKIFASTHSASFVRGCIQSGAPVNIVRLTYRNSIPTARILQHDDLVRLMRDPLLRSTGAIGGLFYEFVVVCEGDADRAFYEEINELLAITGDVRAVPNCLFLNAQNKQTIPTIVLPLRELGIPAAGIVDLDVVKEGGQVWAKQLIAAGIPDAEHPSLADLRRSILERLNAADEQWKRNGGIGVLAGQDLEAAQNFVERLARYGLFIVQGGELESWLKPLQATGHGPSWLINIFGKIGSNPEDANYVRPADDDVWQFVGKIREWVFAVDRRGIPT